MAKTTKAARDLLKKHVPDPVRDLFDDVEAALTEAGTTYERRAISRAAVEALDALGLDRAAAEAATVRLARLTDPRAAVQAPRLEVVNDEYRGTGEHVTVEEWAQRDPGFGKVLAAVTGTENPAEKLELLGVAGQAGLDPTSLQFVQLLMVEATEADPEAATEFRSAQRRKADEARLAEHQAAEEARVAGARRAAFFEAKWAEHAKQIEAEVDALMEAG